MIRKTRKGSTIVSGTVSASSSAAVSSMNTALNSALAAGNNVQGYNFISSSVIANGLTADPSSSSLGLILGVSIPLFLISNFLLIQFLYYWFT
jgi:hypothetical protein